MRFHKFKMDVIHYLIKLCKRTEDALIAMKFKEQIRVTKASYRKHMERKTNVKIVTKGELS